jgi:hypothetical protein
MSLTLDWMYAAHVMRKTLKWSSDDGNSGSSLESGCQFSGPKMVSYDLLCVHETNKGHSSIQSHDHHSKCQQHCNKNLLNTYICYKLHELGTMSAIVTMLPHTCKFQMNPSTAVNSITYSNVESLMVSTSDHTTVVLFLTMRSNNGGSHPVMTATRSQESTQFKDNTTTGSTNSQTLKKESHKPFHFKQILRESQ